ncbi:MAG: sulfite exporter TauE/SafE family protein [Hyphomonadaceae bacterium]
MPPPKFRAGHLIYLPIAEMPVNVLLVLLVSGCVGFVSGLVGVGGGFIMTPALIFLGVPAPVAVATGASQIAATSFSGIMTQTRRKSVDWRMGLLLSIGGVIGSVGGVALFERLLRIGQLDLIISLLYLVLLAGVGVLMLRESYHVWRGRTAKSVSILRRPLRTVAHSLPFRLRFPRSGLYVSVVPPLALGFGIGALAAIMGVGGGFILVPAMIYLLRMPTNVVIGTSLFQVLIVTSLIVILQSAATQTVDLVLAALLMLGGVVGAQIGARLGAGMKSEHIRGMLGALLVGAAAKFLFDLVITPAETYVLGGGLG